ncbi:hypothetical protein PtB15_11B278 [Puccinia triticina]|nr:hypothetical protein PtB15_11B278 [Puccinia triticina]
MLYLKNVSFILAFLLQVGICFSVLPNNPLSKAKAAGIDAEASSMGGSHSKLSEIELGKDDCNLIQKEGIGSP